MWAWNYGSICTAQTILRLFQKTTRPYFCSPFCLLSKEACLYAGADWLSSSVSHRVARGQWYGRVFRFYGWYFRENMLARKRETTQFNTPKLTSKTRQGNACASRRGTWNPCHYMLVGDNYIAALPVVSAPFYFAPLVCLKSFRDYYWRKWRLISLYNTL